MTLAASGYAPGLSPGNRISSVVILFLSIVKWKSMSARSSQAFDDSFGCWRFDEARRDRNNAHTIGGNLGDWFA
jgi:hypothetical protein